jgi:transposase
VAALGAVRGRADRQAIPQFAASFQAITQRRGKKIATTAVARKLLTRAWHLLTDAERAAAPQPAAASAARAAR